MTTIAIIIAQIVALIALIGAVMWLLGLVTLADDGAGDDDFTT